MRLRAPELLTAIISMMFDGMGTVVYTHRDDTGTDTLTIEVTRGIPRHIACRIRTYGVVELILSLFSYMNVSLKLAILNFFTGAFDGSMCARSQDRERRGESIIPGWLLQMPLYALD